MSTIAQFFIEFTTAMGGNIPDQIAMQKAAERSLDSSGYVISDPRFGVRNMTRDTLLVDISRKDKTDRPIPGIDVKYAILSLQQMTGCTSVNYTTVETPITNQGTMVAPSTTLKLRHLIHMQCG